MLSLSANQIGLNLVTFLFCRQCLLIIGFLLVHAAVCDSYHDSIGFNTKDIFTN
jgi:hypothetical protein